MTPRRAEGPSRRPGVAALARALSIALAASAPLPACAAPAAASEVVERLPVAAGDPRLVRLAQLQAAVRRSPDDADAAAALAAQFHALAVGEDDPRWIGRGEAALAPWWRPGRAVPPRLLAARAALRYADHRHAEALADARAALQGLPGDPPALAIVAAVHVVQGRPDAARQACAAWAPAASPLLRSACIAQADALSGAEREAAQALRSALADAPDAPASERTWAATRLAEIETIRGATDPAESAFRDALAAAASTPDIYLLAAWSDFLLDRGRHEEVLALLQGREASDTLLLRLALAAKALATPAWGRLAREMEGRFEALRPRGDTRLRREEARFALHVRGDAQQALALALAQFAQSRELADARVLLEAAHAAHDAAAADPVQQWIAGTGLAAEPLRRWQQRLKDLR